MNANLSKRSVEHNCPHSVAVLHPTAELDSCSRNHRTSKPWNMSVWPFTDEVCWLTQNWLFFFFFLWVGMWQMWEAKRGLFTCIANVDTQLNCKLTELLRSKPLGKKLIKKKKIRATTNKHGIQLWNFQWVYVGELDRFWVSNPEVTYLLVIVSIRQRGNLFPRESLASAL